MDYGLKPGLLVLPVGLEHDDSLVLDRLIDQLPYYCSVVGFRLCEGPPHRVVKRMTTKRGGTYVYGVVEYRFPVLR